MQRHFWVVDRFAALAGRPERLAVTCVAFFEGPLDLARLRRAWAHLVARHGQLRSRIFVQGAKPLQSDASDVPLVYEDAREGEARARQILEAAIGEPIDLSREPAANALLVRVGDERYALVVRVHHHSFDLTSCHILALELCTLYAQDCAPDALPPPAMTYRDFVDAEIAKMKSPAIEEQLAFWKSYLSDLPPAPGFRFRPSSSARPSEGFVYRARTLPLASVDQLKATALRLGVTQYALCATALSKALEEIVDGPLVVVGCPTANRRTPEVQGLVGCLINIVPYILRLDGPADLRARAQEVSRTLSPCVKRNVPLGALMRHAGTLTIDLSMHVGLFELPQAIDPEPWMSAVFPVPVTGTMNRLDVGDLRVTCGAYPPRSPGVALEIFFGGNKITAEADGAIFDEPRLERLLEAIEHAFGELL